MTDRHKNHLLAFVAMIMTDNKETFYKAYSVATDSSCVKKGVWLFLTDEWQEVNRKRWNEKKRKQELKKNEHI